MLNNNNRETTQEKLKIPSAVNLYKYLYDLRGESFGSEVEISLPLGGTAKAKISEKFRRVEKKKIIDLDKVNADVDRGNKQVDVIGKYTPYENYRYEPLLQITNEDLEITLEGAKIYNFGNGTMRKLALSNDERKLVFKVKDKEGAFFVEIEQDGTIKYIYGDLSKPYMNREGEFTDEESYKTTVERSKVINTVTDKKEVPISVKELVTRIPLSKILETIRGGMKKEVTTTRDVYGPVTETVSVPNKSMIGNEVELKERANKADLARYLMAVLEQSFEALEKERAESGWEGAYERGNFPVLNRISDETNEAVNSVLK